MTTQSTPIAKPQASRLARLWRDPAVRTALMVYLIFRVISAAAGFWVGQVAPPKIDWAKQPIYNLHEIAFTTQGPLRAWLEPWYRWDTGWYVSIAYRGYQADDGSIIFAPLYPFMMRLTAPLVGGDYLLGGLVVSNISCIIALILLYKLIAPEYGDQTAQQTILLYMAYPAAFYLMAAYTESLFMALMLGAWLATRRRSYWLAGGLAFFAALSRTQGWILAFPFTYLIYIEPYLGNVSATGNPAGSLADLIRRWATGFRVALQQPLALLRPLPAILGGPLGTAAYLLGVQVVGLGSVSDAFAKPPWNLNIVPPWQSLISAARVLLNGTANANDLANIASFLLVVIFGVLVILRMKPSYWLYIWVTLGFILLRSHNLIQLHGMVRYVLDMFPIFIIFALLLRRRTPQTNAIRLGYLILAGALQVWLITLFATFIWVS